MIQGLAAIDTVASAASAFTGAAGAANVGRNVETSFSEALAAAAGRAVDRLEHAEGLSLKAVSGGEIETREVVDAVMNAEQTLQATIAIRDKIVTAYLEISRMAI